MLILPLFLLSVVPVCLVRRHEPARGDAADGYPESMTAHLAADAEEYLAWLADHHWPDDEYMELEPGWRSDSDDAHPCPMCPGCRRPGQDVWPCHECGMLVHAGCGHGMRRRKIARPYRTRDMGSEVVVAEWRCKHCASVVGLDVDHGDDRGSGLPQ
jgi:hypothetical protein